MRPSIQAEQTGVNVLQPKLTDAQRTAGVGNKLSKVTKRRMWVESSDLEDEQTWNLMPEGHMKRRREESQWGEVIGLCP